MNKNKPFQLINRRISQKRNMQFWNQLSFSLTYAWNNKSSGYTTNIFEKKINFFVLFCDDFARENKYYVLHLSWADDVQDNDECKKK